MNDDSYLTVRDGKVTAYVGPDATDLCRAILLKSSLDLYAKCGMIPTRGMTITKMLAMASIYTHHRYGRGADNVRLAAADVQIWIDAMRAALPQVEVV